DLLPEEQFRLYADCARFPQQRASSGLLRSVSEGVYEVDALGRRFRIIVANQLPQQEHNALLHLFSTKAELLSYGVQHYRIRSEETSTLLLQLFQRYRQEGLTMPDILEEVYRETIEQLLKELPVEKRLEGLSPEERIKGIPRETLEELLRKLKDNGSSASPS